MRFHQEMFSSWTLELLGGGIKAISCSSTSSSYWDTTHRFCCQWSHLSFDELLWQHIERYKLHDAKNLMYKGFWHSSILIDPLGSFPTQKQVPLTSPDLWPPFDWWSINNLNKYLQDNKCNFQNNSRYIAGSFMIMTIIIKKKTNLFFYTENHCLLTTNHVSELHSRWPLKRACAIPAALLFEMMFSRLLFPVCQRAGACRSSEQNWGFFTRALLFEGGLSGKISITSVVMEPRLFWKASLSSLSAPGSWLMPEPRCLFSDVSVLMCEYMMWCAILHNYKCHRDKWTFIVKLFHQPRWYNVRKTYLFWCELGVIVIVFLDCASPTVPCSNISFEHYVLF